MHVDKFRLIGQSGPAEGEQTPRPEEQQGSDNDPRYNQRAARPPTNFQTRQLHETDTERQLISRASWEVEIRSVISLQVAKFTPAKLSQW